MFADPDQRIRTVLTLVLENETFSLPQSRSFDAVRANDRRELHACQVDRRTLLRDSVAATFGGYTESMAARTGDDIWGERTPYSPGQAWPVRVDLHLVDGLTVDEIDSWVPSACLLCSNGCGLDIAVKDGRMVGVRGRAEDRVNHGRLGPKVCTAGRGGFMID